MTRQGSPARPRRVLPVLVFSQFAATSLWFAVNAVMPDMRAAWNLPASAVGLLTSAVQLGFVAGTLAFALLMVADRFSPSRVFLTCALLGAALNAATLATQGHMGALFALRFAVGFLLAGIYPVGMKIAASWYTGGLGGALGVLIGALILGTALPHGLRAVAGSESLPWQSVVAGVSLLAAVGGTVLAMALPPPPASAPRAGRLGLRALSAIWSDTRLRASAGGYFGHMWELYAFIVLVPAIAAVRVRPEDVSTVSFWVIAAGCAGCVLGGRAAPRWGSARVAGAQLAASGACCLLAPFMLTAPLPLFLTWLVMWGTTVSGDSPQFSALTARNAPPDAVGSVLTLVNSIGFAISVVTIEVFVRASLHVGLAAVLPWLGIGPAAGLVLLWPLLRKDEAAARN